MNRHDAGAHTPDRGRIASRSQVSPEYNNVATKSDLVAFRTHLQADLAQLEQRTTLRIMMISASANGILFAALHHLPPAT